ncbi:MAG: TetR/AcrR family transcriptional regulator [Sphingomonadales bacterium]|nr:TetR/AcrR family transcriptional regulator [Sphingomonadales bacterium]
MDDAILDAALEQMAEQGYQRMSFDSVAKVAGVGKATIYRRWSSKAEVATAALSKRIDSEPQLKQKAFSKEALISMLGAIRERLLQPNNMALVGTLLAEEKQTPELISLFRERVWHRRSSMIRSVLEQGQREGRIAKHVDLDIVIDMIIGSMYASYLRRNTIPADWPERAVETIWRGIGTVTV